VSALLHDLTERMRQELGELEMVVERLLEAW